MAYVLTPALALVAVVAWFVLVRVTLVAVLLIVGRRMARRMVARP